MTVDVHVAGFKGVADDPKALVRRIRAESEKLGVSVEAYDASVVLGVEHLAEAWMRARRALSNGSAAADSLEMEARLFVTCERQIKGALEKSGVKSGRPLALASERAGAVEAVAKTLGLVPDGAVLEVCPEKLAYWGFPATARGAADQIFERMSLMEAER
jgi:tRNA threonylcarbamoyladenosine modification (KEOPS) complex Cgi121 subunit